MVDDLTSSLGHGGADHTIRRAARGDVRVPSGRGGTGRHAGFRCRWRKPWGFESLRPHPASVAVPSGRCVIAGGAGVRSPDVPQLALTFDDGPDPRWTTAVLAALRAAGATATFFVLGECVRRHPDVVRAAVADGHAVEVHADRHTSHADMTRDQAAADLEAVARRPRRPGRPAGALAHAVGDRGRLDPRARGRARPRGRRLDGRHEGLARRRGRRHARRRPSRLRDGAIVLAHDGLGPGALRDGCDETVALVAPLVAAARERGLEPGALR